MSNNEWIEQLVAMMEARATELDNPLTMLWEVSVAIASYCAPAEVVEPVELTPEIWCPHADGRVLSASDGLWHCPKCGGVSA